MYLSYPLVLLETKYECTNWQEIPWTLKFLWLLYRGLQCIHKVAPSDTWNSTVWSFPYKRVGSCVKNSTRSTMCPVKLIWNFRGVHLTKDYMLLCICSVIYRGYHRKTQEHKSNTLLCLLWSVTDYIITQVIFTFWLSLAYDRLHLELWVEFVWIQHTVCLHTLLGSSAIIWNHYHLEPPNS